MKNLIYTLLASVLLSACSCKKNDTPTYTFSGQYLEDCKLKPRANTSLYLENESTGEKIAEASTKLDGSFSLQYKIQNGGILNLVDATSDEVIFKEVPINKDHSQTVFVKNFIQNKIRVSIRNSLFIGDTLFISSGLNNECNNNFLKITTQSASNAEIYAVFRVINDLNFDFFVNVPIGNAYHSVVYEKNENLNSGFAWGIGEKEFLKSVHSGYIFDGDTIETGYHRFTIDHSPYPAVNEYTLVIE